MTSYFIGVKKLSKNLGNILVIANQKFNFKQQIWWSASYAEQKIICVI